MDEMPSYVFTEWMAYYNLEPFGDELTDFHLAQVTAILYNANKPKNGKSKRTDDFRLWKQIKTTFSPGEFFENLKGYLRPPPSPPPFGKSTKMGEERKE